MTKPAQTTAAQTKEAAVTEAYAHIHGQVYAPVFFEKLASDFGIKPESEEECYDMLAMATKLRTAHDMTQQKQAAAAVSSRQSFLKTAHEHLDAVLQKQGLAAAPQQQTDHEAQVKAAAATLTLDPGIASAVLQLAAASI